MTHCVVREPCARSLEPGRAGDRVGRSFMAVAQTIRTRWAQAMPEASPDPGAVEGAVMAALDRVDLDRAVGSSASGPSWRIPAAPLSEQSGPGAPSHAGGEWTDQADNPELEAGVYAKEYPAAGDFARGLVIKGMS
jgi:hypothetical protein